MHATRVNSVVRQTSEDGDHSVSDDSSSKSAVCQALRYLSIAIGVELIGGVASYASSSGASWMNMKLGEHGDELNDQYKQVNSVVDRSQSGKVIFEPTIGTNALVGTAVIGAAALMAMMATKSVAKKVCQAYSNLTPSQFAVNTPQQSPQGNFVNLEEGRASEGSNNEQMTVVDANNSASQSCSEKAVSFWKNRGYYTKLQLGVAAGTLLAGPVSALAEELGRGLLNHFLSASIDTTNSFAALSLAEHVEAGVVGGAVYAPVMGIVVSTLAWWASAAGSRARES